MKFLKNLSVRLKLLILTVPLVIALVILLIVMAVQLNQTEKEISKVYYDILYKVNSSLVNGDRDFYQAVFAATQYYDLAKGFSDAPADQLQTYMDSQLADFDENSQQVIDEFLHHLYLRVFTLAVSSITCIAYEIVYEPIAALKLQFQHHAVVLAEIADIYFCRSR